MSESGTSRGGFPLQGVYRPGGELPLSPWRRGPLEGLSWEASLLLPPGTAREIRPFLEGPLLGAAGAVTVPVDPASWGEGSERPQGVLVEDLEDWEAILEGAAREKPLYVAAFGGTPLVYPLLKAWGKKQGVDLQGWRGAFLGDPFGQGPLPSSLALELFLEMLEEGREQPSSFSLVSVTPLSLRREGATAAFEGAMALQRMRRWRKALQERGLPFEALLGQAPVLLGLGMDFFEEVARLRALRALWAKETGGTFPLFHGWTLLPEAEPLEPENDAIRAALEIMAGVLGGVKVIHGGPVGGSWGFPPSVARRMALMMQKILKEETGVSRTADPLGGSWFLEDLTARMEAAMARMAEGEDQNSFPREEARPLVGRDLFGGQGGEGVVRERPPLPRKEKEGAREALEKVKKAAARGEGMVASLEEAALAGATLKGMARALGEGWQKREGR